MCQEVRSVLQMWGQTAAQFFIGSAFWTSLMVLKSVGYRLKYEKRGHFEITRNLKDPHLPPTACHVLGLQTPGGTLTGNFEEHALRAW